MSKEQRNLLIRIGISAVGLILLNILPVEGTVRLILFLVDYLLIAYDVIIEAAEGLWHKKVLDENFLMTVASIGAFALAIYQGSGDFNEAVAVVLFYKLGEFFEDYAVDKSRDNISNLMDIRP